MLWFLLPVAGLAALLFLFQDRMIYFPRLYAPGDLRLENDVTRAPKIGQHGVAIVRQIGHFGGGEPLDAAEHRNDRWPSGAKMKTHPIVGLLSLLAIVVSPALAQDYPAKPVCMVVPFSPGASTDIMARVVAQRLSEAFKQQYLVENRAAGGGGTVGTGFVAKSAPDGYTLMMANNSVLNVAPHVYRKVPYDAIQDFAPIALVAWVPVALTVHPSLSFTIKWEL